MKGDSVASSRSKPLDALYSRYTCIQKPIPAADAARSDNNRRYLTSLWVFVSREVDDRQSPPLARGPQRIIEKVTAALKVISIRDPRVLVQFWFPTAVKKRLLLTTLDQPFGFGVVDEGLYEYRLKSERCMFVVDDDHGEVLVPPARVYRQKLPEWSVDITAQDWAASHNIHGYVNLPVFEPDSGCCVGVLELVTSSIYVDFSFEVQQVSTALKDENLKSPNVLQDTSFYARVGDETRELEITKIFQALKMLCDTHNLPLAQTWGPCGYSSVVANSGTLERSCSSFNRNCIGKVCMSTAGLAFYVRDMSKWDFHEACRSRHLDKSQGVVGKSLSSRGLCFCGDVSQLGEDEYPLVYYARMHRLTSCLGIYLKSIEAGDEYVVELFLPTQSEDENDAYLKILVRTLKQCFTNASRIQLGDMSSIQAIGGIPRDWNLEFSTVTEILRPSAENEKNDGDADVAFIKKLSDVVYVEHMEEVNPLTSAAAAEKRREKFVDYYEEPVGKRKRSGGLISLKEISKHFGKTIEEATNSLRVSRSTLKRVCKNHGIPRWPYTRTPNENDPLMNLDQTDAPIHVNVVDQRLLINARMEEVCDNLSLMKEHRARKRDSDLVLSSNTITVVVRFGESIQRFAFLHSDGLSNLENKVAKRFKIEGQRARLKYKDEDGDWILICNDDDLRSAMGTSGRLKLICKPEDV